MSEHREVELGCATFGLIAMAIAALASGLFKIAQSIEHLAAAAK